MNAAQAPAGNILVVDDTPANLRLLSGMLREAGYRVRPAPSGAAALRAVAAEAPDMILLDINMPEMNGYEVCQTLKADPAAAEIPVLFISALNETQDKVEAFRAGGVDYVTKPFQFEEVLARVQTHLTLAHLRAEMRVRNEVLEARVAEQVRIIAEGQMATIFALSKLAESRDDDTGKHLERTRTFCRILAENLSAHGHDVSRTFIDNVFNASVLHDVGKVAIPDAVLCKPRKLDDDEFRIMQSHTVRGAETLARVLERHPDNAFLQMGREIARSHHEKWNGRGYPDGLSGTDIPLSARIMAVADVYDALTSKRCYKDAFSHERSRDIIVGDRGVHFDPDLVDAFERCEETFRQTRAELDS